MLQKIYFRADGNNKMGNGHVIRSLALADILRGMYEITFIIQEPAAWLLQEIRKMCDDVITLPANVEFQDEASSLASMLKESDIIVLDGYNFTTSYQQRIQESKCKIVCVDDLHAYHFLADVVINHAGGTNKEDYVVEAFTKLSLGPEFALLRRPFRESDKKEKVILDFSSIFICFGGADTNHLALRSAELCLNLPCIREIHIVSSDPLIEPFIDNVKQNKKGKIFFYKDLSAEEMVSVMKLCHAAICPASSISYEICSIGMGLLTGIHADNQKTIAQYLDESGCAKNIGDFRAIENDTLKTAISGLNEQIINSQICNQRKFFKDSTEPIRFIFEKLNKENEFTIRRATEKDLDVYYNWATDPIVRQNSVNTGNIAIEKHIEWFASKLNSLSTIMYVIEQLGKPVSQVRFEREQETYSINYSIDKEYRQRGLSEIVIKLALKELSKELNVRPSINAIVKTGNIASSRAFLKNSFSFEGMKNIEGITYETYQK